MEEKILKDTEERMKKALEASKKELATLRCGRATPAILERVQVECYNTIMPLTQLCTISVPEPRLLIVQPFDKSIISEIEKAIVKSDLGLVPINDGNILRIPVPALTEERRKELVKVAKKFAEQGRISIRSIRRDANEEIKKLEKDGKIPEDESKKTQDKIQKLTDKYIEETDKITEAKEKEIMEV